jgi:Pectate lyase superfamily protein
MTFPSPIFENATVNTALTYTATGGTVARTAENRAADSLNLLDYIQPGETDHTAGFNSVVAAALALNRPVEIYIPAGAYTISGTINITPIAAVQGIYLCGAGSGCVTITQIADADGIVALPVVDASQYNSGIFSASGFKLVMAAPAGSTTRNGLTVNSMSVSGSEPIPNIYHDLVFASGATSWWAIGLNLSQAPSSAFISNISTTYANKNGGVSLFISGGASAYSAGISVRDTSFIGGNIGVQLGNYLQGLTFDNINTINTNYAFSSVTTAGLQIEYKISNSYLYGKTLFQGGISPNGAQQSLKFVNCYFDALDNSVPDGDNHVSFINVPGLLIVNSAFSGPGNNTNSNTGLYIAGPQTYSTNIVGVVIGGYLNANGRTIHLGPDTKDINFVGTNLLNYTNGILDEGTNNTFMSTKDAGGSYVFGFNGAPTTLLSSVAGTLRAVAFTATLATANNTFAGLVSANKGLNVAGGPVNVNGTVNNIAIAGAGVSGSPATVTAFGSDTDIGLTLNTKGAGQVFAQILKCSDFGLNIATPVGRQTVTGSRGGNAALASLLTALAAFGLITDSTSA